MTNRKVLLGMVAVLLAAGLSGCGGGGKSALAGTWFLIEGGDRLVPLKCELLRDGTGFALDQAITWKTEKNRVYITHPYLAMAFDYKLSGSKLTLSDDTGKTHVYTNKLGGNAAIAGTWTDIEDNEWVFGPNGMLSYENGGKNDIRTYQYFADERKLVIQFEGALQTYTIFITDAGKTATLTEGSNFYSWNTAGPGWSVNHLRK
jgi:hypothetical protein